VEGDTKKARCSDEECSRSSLVNRKIERHYFPVFLFLPFL
jgi:hypothetical protein